MVFGLSSGGETLDELEFFIEEFQLDYPVMFDADATYWKYRQAGGSSPYPLDYIIDPQGKVAYFSTEYEPERMTQIIDGLLGRSPEIRFEPESLNLGPVALGESAWTLLGVFNDGDGELHVSDIGSSSQDFSANMEEMVLAPGSSQALLVEFTPSELGPVFAELSLATDDADESLVVLPLYGEGVEGTGADIPSTPFALGQNEPNPFSGQTQIRYTLPGSEAVWLTLYDVRGRAVRHLALGERRGEGEGTAVWDGRDDAGRDLPSGVYFYKLRVGSMERTRKAILLR